MYFFAAEISRDFLRFFKITLTQCTRLRNLCESVSQESSKTLHDDAMLLHRDYLISSLGQVHIEIVQNNQFINFLNWQQ